MIAYKESPYMCQEEVTLMVFILAAFWESLCALFWKCLCAST